MTRHALLNNVTHKNLRVITRHGARYGENIGSVPTFPTEYGDIQREYPIFFRKDAGSGELHSIALLGFAKDENLFLEGDSWNARYIPGMIARGPFLVGFQERESHGDLNREPVIHVDLDDPRISETEGEPVFLPHGGNSHYLERVAATLSGLHEGMTTSKAMFAAFSEFDLIEPVKIEVKLGPDEQYDLVGLHTISEEKLRGLGGDALVKLNRAGFLQGAFLVIASLNNMKKLIDMKHRRRGQQAGAVA